MTSGHSRAVFLDRDGVIDRAIVKDGKPYPPASLSELELLPGVPAALEALKDAGFLLIVVSNQPDVARGAQKREIVEAMNARLLATLPLDDILVCYHDDADGCDCRKPKPGLLLRAAEAHKVDLSQSFMIGDRCRDVAAGRRAGCRTVLIDYGYSEGDQNITPDSTAESLSDAAAWVLSFAR